MAQKQHRRKARYSSQGRRKRNLPEMLQNVPKLRKEATGGAADPEQMRNLADDSHVDQAFDEATHDWRGNEAGDPTHARKAKQKEENSDHDGQGRSERIELGGPVGR